jgi:exopolyphosphatase/guanosine-5'-triphosphate,3'-diphosphate pyrophosphatase
MIRLGEGLFLERKLNPQAIRRAEHAFISFKNTAQRFQVEKIVAFATSALREASDADLLVEKIRSKTQIEISVISGDEEAKLIALGVLNHKNFKGRYGLIDIGGGSTEISICEDKKVLHSASFPLGAARLQQIFLKTSPPKAGAKLPDPIQTLRLHIRHVLQSKAFMEHWGRVPFLVGSSGTVKALERISKKSLQIANGIHLKNLKKLTKTMGTQTRSELLNTPGMEAKRVDIILSGAILLEECMNQFKASVVLTTNYSLRDGILFRESQHALAHEATSAKPVKHDPKSLLTVAERFDLDPEHVKHLVTLADNIFEETKNLHKLSRNWIPYLTAAIILRDSGEIIAHNHHEIHSAYIIRNTEIRNFEPMEIEFIAQLCLFHHANRISKKEIPFAKDKTTQLAFIRLLPLVHIADALDVRKKNHIKIESMALMPNKAKLTLSGRGATDLEVLRIEQKKTLFEKVYGRRLYASII